MNVVNAGRTNIVDIYPMPNRHLRIWTKNVEEPRNRHSVPDGDFVGKGEYTAAQLGFTSIPGSVTLYVEGTTNSFELADQEITATVKGRVRPDGQEKICHDAIRCTVIRVDVDVDTDNNNGFYPPDRSLVEDQFEDIVDVGNLWPGKIIAVNSGDSDADGIPDFADGYNLLGSSSSADDVCATAHFVPIVFEIPKPIDLSVARIKLEYDASDPMGVTTNGSGGYVPARGSVRIWRKPGEVPRDGTNLLHSGDFVSTNEYSAAEFGFSDDVRVVTNYIEAVSNSVSIADKRIVFLVDPNGTVTDPPYFLAADAVRLTILKVDLDIDSDNDNKFDAPSRIDPEDAVEDVAGKQEYGKWIPVNSDDNDGDGIPDYLDGFNLTNGPSADADDINTKEMFVPMVLDLPEPIDPSVALVQFDYDAADPSSANASSPGSGHLRIWAKPGNVARNKNPVGGTQSGDYIAKKTPMTCAQLGISASCRKVTVYVEGTNPSTVWGDQRIEVQVDPDGTGSTGFMCVDAVRVSVIDAAYTLFVVLPYAREAGTLDRWFYPPDYATPRTMARTMRDGFLIYRDTEGPPDWHGGTGDMDDANNIYGHVFARLSYQGPPIVSGSYIWEYYGKTSNGKGNIFSVEADIVAGLILWHGFPGARNSQGYCDVFANNTSMIAMVPGGDPSERLIQRHRWTITSVKVFESLYRFCEPWDSVSNPDGTHYEKYGLDVDAPNCWGGCVVLGGEVLRKANSLYGNLPEYAYWQIGKTMPFVFLDPPVTGMIDMLNQFVAKPGSASWGGLPVPGYSGSLRFYDTGKMGLWMIGNKYDSIHIPSVVP